ncbi:MAG: 50S ribosomal protein L4 [Candidatus Moranbacteria bacterium]|nr:50S ribosomal protein L4 [Candidatus Moranbacteria bacterium]
MMRVTVKNIAGEDVKEISLKDFIFDVPKNDALVHQVYVAQSGNKRIAIAHTKDRAERAGSGIKPWRQKGTGRARSGSVRSPLWRKGGVTFGPTKDRNFSKNTTHKMRQKATMIALSEKIRQGVFIVLDEWRYTEKKTKLFAHTLSALGVGKKSALLALAADEKHVSLMSRNIPKVEHMPVEAINVLQLLDREYVVVTEAGIKALEARFAAWERQETKQ